MTNRLQEVGEQHPSAEVRLAVRDALRAAVADLGLPASTRVTWCIRESSSSRRLRAKYGDAAIPWRVIELEGASRGMCDPANPVELWIRSDQTPEDAANTVRHEARHSWQLQPAARRWTLPGLTTMDQREADAESYAETVIKAPPAAVRKERAPVLRPDTTVTRASLAPQRKTRKFGNDTFVECEVCLDWIKLGGGTHRCFGHRGLVPNRRAVPGADGSGGYQRPSYETKVVR